MKNTKILTKLEKFLSTKNTTQIQTFLQETEKNEGATTGYIATKNHSKYMIKTENKKIKDHPLTWQASKNRSNFFREYLTGILYKRFLYDRAPEIQLVQTNTENELIGLSSQYLVPFETLKKYAEQKKNQQQIEGGGKLFAVTMFLGENDLHWENVGVTRPHA